MDKKSTQLEQNECMGHFILSTVKNHHCNFCNMIAESCIRGKGTKRVDRMYARKLSNNATVPRCGTDGAARY